MVKHERSNLSESLDKSRHVPRYQLFLILTLSVPIETIVSLQYQPAPSPSHYQNIPYQPKTTVPIGYPESTPDTNY